MRAQSFASSMVVLMMCGVSASACSMSYIAFLKIAVHMGLGPAVLERLDEHELIAVADAQTNPASSSSLRR